MTSEPRLRALVPWLLLAGLLAMVLRFAHALMVPAWVGHIGDDGMYVTTARALADGLGYRYPYSPELEHATRYPILYPAMLAVIARLVTDPMQQLLAMQWHTLAHLLAFLALSYAFLVRYLKVAPLLALGLVALVGLNPIVLNLAGQVMSDVPFAGFSMLALFGVAAATRRASPGRIMVAGGLIALACMVRYQGVALLAAGILALWGERRFKAGFGLLASFIGAFLPWMLWVVTHRALEYGSNFQMMTEGMALARILRELSRSAHFVVTKAIPSAYVPALTPTFDGDPFLLAAPPALLLAGYGLTFLTILGLVAGLIRPRDGVERLVALYALLTVALVAVWNTGYNYLGYWQSVRLLLAVMPFFAIFGLRFVASRLPEPVRARKLVAGGLALGTVLSMAGVGRALEVEWRAMADRAMAQRAYSQLFAFVRLKVPEDRVIASTAVPLMYIYTGRQGRNIFLSADWFAHASVQQGMDYLMITPTPYAGTDVAMDFLDDTRKRYPELLELAYANSQSGISLWRVDRAHAAP